MAADIGWIVLDILSIMGEVKMKWIPKLSITFTNLAPLRSNFSFTKGYWMAVCDGGNQIGIRLIPILWIVLWIDLNNTIFRKQWPKWSDPGYPETDETEES